MIKFVDGDTKRTPDRMFFVNVLERLIGPCFSHVNVNVHFRCESHIPAVVFQ